MLLEREAEVAQLDATLTAARDASGRILLIEGPAGIGKTRLLDEARGRAQAGGLRVLRARGGELERGHGFGIVRQLLEATVAQAGDADRVELLAGAAALADAVFATSRSSHPTGLDTSQAVLHGLYWLVANLGERRPLLLTIDDLQWADVPSLRFLVYLARRLEGMPVAVVLALRTGEPTSAPEFVQALRLEAHPPILDPRELSIDATAILTAQRLGPDVPEDLARACHAATRGNPFLLIELLHGLRRSADRIDPSTVGRVAPQRVAAAILLRVARIGARADALVRAASVLGESAELATVATLAGLDVTDAAALAAALARAEILEPHGASRAVRFVHPLVRTAVYEDMAPAQRAQLHARAADLLGGRPSGTEAAAVHLLYSDPAGDARTVELLRQAARAAIERGAPESAVPLLRRAAAEPPDEATRPAVLLELGAAASRSGEPGAVELLREAFVLADGQPARAHAGLELSLALGVSSSQSLDTVAVLERAREGLRDERLQALLDARLVMFAVCVPAARGRLSARLLEARQAIERRSSEPPRALLSALTAEMAFTAAPAEDAARCAERALGSGELMREDIAMESDFAMSSVWALIHSGRLRTAKQHLDDGAAHARTRGSPFALARIACFRALVCWRMGELRNAESDADTALSVVAAWGIPRATSSAVLAAVRIERGDVAGARAALDGVDGDPAVLEVLPSQIVREVRAALLAAQGEPREALRELLAYVRWEERCGLGEGMVPVVWRTSAALTHLQLGEVSQARGLVADELHLARRLGAPPRLGSALRVMGVVEGPDGRALLEEAVDVLAQSDARLDHARALADLGALLVEAGDRPAAINLLRTAMELAHRCGASALLQACAAQLRLAGARPRRLAVSGRDSLTPSERRVSDLASEGMSNKEIAQALFVTLRTVELHLSNSYRKLGITGREQLPSPSGEA